jgi:Ca2+-binding RTX toxin-like protein
MTLEARVPSRRRGEKQSGFNVQVLGEQSVTHTINGTSGNDTIGGTSGNDTILAKAGDDVITAGSGNDKVDGGAGNDTIDGGSGNDKIDGGTGNDTISGGSGNDLIDGGSGNDTITGGSGNDLIYGGSGIDTAIFGGNYATYDIFDLCGLVIIKGQDGTDLVLDVEYLKFDDGSYNVATNVFTPTPPPAPPVVSLTPATVTGEEGTTLTFTFTRTGGDLSQPLTINYVVNDGPPLGGATRADGDFSYPSGMQQLTFAAGQTTATITVQTTEDSNVEGDESFPVLLAGGLDYTVDPVNNGSTGVIQNDDVAAPVVVTVVATDGVGTEASGDEPDFTFTFTRTGDLTQPLAVNYGIIPAPIDGATPGADFFTLPSPIIFAPGSATVVLSFNAIDDAEVENTELFAVVLQPGAGYTFNTGDGSATANAIITDNDVAPPPPPPVVSLTPGVVTGEEGDALTFTFTRTGGDTSQPLTINYVVNDGPPAGGATRADGDFSYPSGMQQLTFAAGQTVATITVQTTEDSNVEGDESFPVLLALGLDYTVDPVNNGSTGVIQDNDVAPPPSLSISDVSANEEAGTITFTVTLSAAAALPVSFEYSTSDGSAGASDYVGVTGQLGTIPAGQTSTTITIALTNDAIIEPGGETFLVNLSNPVGATIADGQAVGTILEQDQLINGTNGPDTALIGGPGVLLEGGAGDDTINGLGGDDAMAGGPGSDTLNGGGGFDQARYVNASGAISVMMSATSTVTGNGAVDSLNSIEEVRGSAHNDTFVATTSFSGSNGQFNSFEGRGGDDHITGNGQTRIRYDSASAAVHVDLQTGTAHSVVADDANIGVDTIVLGTATPNGIQPLVNTVFGSSFDDQLYGSDNFNDPGTLGFETTESFRGGAGNDLIDGRGGGDRADYTQSTGAITADFSLGANAGDGTVQDGLGFTDTLISVEIVSGTNQNDFFYGGVGKNVFRGEGGADWFDGGVGNDDFTGGAGADTYAFTAAADPSNTDALHDFVTGEDKIALSRSVYGAAELTGGGVRIVTGAPTTNEATFIYDANPANPLFDGVLLFDPDGNDGAFAVTVAWLVAPTPLDLVASDLFFI